MENAWPLWALPFWTMGVPLIWAVIELIRTPKTGSSTASVMTDASGRRPIPLPRTTRGAAPATAASGDRR